VYEVIHRVRKLPLLHFELTARLDTRSVVAYEN
jgi:hypothetical protein